MTVGADAFDELQLRLADAIHANRPGSGIDHVMVTLPSFSVSESILSHYGDRIASLEHRYLTAVLIVGRITDCRTVIVLSRLPDPAIIEYYLQLVPADKRASARSRTALIEVHDGTSRSVAAKLLDRPGKGVVLHMLSGLAIDGRFRLTAIGETPDEAARMHEATRAAVAALA